MAGTPLTRNDLRELHCIQAIANVASIMERGILSHAAASNVPHESIAMADIQARRALVTVPGTDRKLHEFANLYVNGRNKMMFKVVRTRGDEDICVLRVSTDVLDLPGVVIADRNASTDTVRFAPAPSGLQNIKKEVVFATYWTHPGDPLAEQRHGAIVCAEVLVPDRVAPEFITGAYVSCETAADALIEAVPDGFRVQVKRGMFFRP